MTSIGRTKVGWVQVNNSVCPYLVRVPFSGIPYRIAPVVILKHAAQINFSQQLNTFQASPNEESILNELCMRADLDFVFKKGTLLTNLSEIHMYTRDRVYISEVSVCDPFGSAKHYMQPQEKQQSTMLPTVVTDFFQEPSSSSTEMKTIPKSTEEPQQDQINLDQKMRLFASHKVIGVQYVTIYTTKLLCIVKQIGKYIPVDELYKTFFSRWPVNTFNFIVTDVLKFRLQTLSHSDLGVVKKLSGHVMSQAKVVKLEKVEKLLPKVKALIKKVPVGSDLRNSSKLELKQQAHSTITSERTTDGKANLDIQVKKEVENACDQMSLPQPLNYRDGTTFRRGSISSSVSSVTSDTNNSSCSGISRKHSVNSTDSEASSPKIRNVFDKFMSDFQKSDELEQPLNLSRSSSITKRESTISKNATRSRHLQGIVEKISKANTS